MTTSFYDQNKPDAIPSKFLLSSNLCMTCTPLEATWIGSFN